MIIVKYKSGANPYVIKTKKEKDKILKKYKNKIIIQKGLLFTIYVIQDI